jgi:hypothetical protein
MTDENMIDETTEQFGVKLNGGIHGTYRTFMAPIARENLQKSTLKLCLMSTNKLLRLCQ